MNMEKKREREEREEKYIYISAEAASCMFTSFEKTIFFDY